MAVSILAREDRPCLTLAIDRLPVVILVRARVLALVHRDELLDLIRFVFYKNCLSNIVLLHFLKYNNYIH